MSKSKKIRVYEMAERIGISYKTFRVYAGSLGTTITSPLKSFEEDEALSMIEEVTRLHHEQADEPEVPVSESPQRRTVHPDAQLVATLPNIPVLEDLLLSRESEGSNIETPHDSRASKNHSRKSWRGQKGHETCAFNCFPKSRAPVPGS